jgi:hypothetical protein
MMQPRRPPPDVQAISWWIMQQPDHGDEDLLATPEAKQAAEYIVAGIPAIAIGDMDGDEPIFSDASWRDFVDQGSVRYFLFPYSQDHAWSTGMWQPAIKDVLSSWEDVSSYVGLPSRSLWRAPARRTDGLPQREGPMPGATGEPPAGAGFDAPPPPR